MVMKLVQLGLSGAAVFGPLGEILQPSEEVLQKASGASRARKFPASEAKVNIDMINSARERFAAEPEVNGDQIVELMEITMRNLLADGQNRSERFFWRGRTFWQRPGRRS